MTTPEDERSTDPHLLAELDESMKVLKDSERELILMKYFQGQTFSAIAAETGRSESAEKMRLKRALEKMAGWLGKKGVTLSVAGLTIVLSTEMGKAAPVGVSSVTLGSVVVTAGTGKMIGVLLVLVAAFGIPIFQKWDRITELEEERTLLNATMGRGSSGMKISARSGRGGKGIRLELTEEEWEMPLEEFAWKYKQADGVRDKIALQRMNKGLEGLTLVELAWFCRYFGRVTPSGIEETVWKVIPDRRENLEFWLGIAASGSRVRSTFGSYCWESLPQAAQWLLDSEKKGGIEPVGHSDYRAELWKELEERVRQGRVKDLDGEGSLDWLRECLEWAPEKLKASFQQSLLRLEGGQE